ncbi:PRTRC system protein E (plasmid) [Sphingobium fuliginis]|jgi:PRTRC genetic system protein E|uniref:PRTRC system protein E n=1 Tax=Sphingobium fuliginis (strain ATCC 27551) TaxID=336203 RepID=A0A7M2GPU4_SPHSA|nr:MULTISPECIES: PRTRC system protein E [Sphingobium]QOT74548.1 PRTRC system protein E [Sphingobium fuliginis]
MLIATMLPLLGHYSLGFDLVAGPDDIVTLTIIPRNAEGRPQSLESGETRPISITASAAEIDAELGLGTDGALGQLMTTRKALAEQIAEQREAAESAREASAQAAKAKATATPVKVPTSSGALATPAPNAVPADAKSDQPASLW